MKRREFITLLGGAAATVPLAARAQQDDRVRRIAVLMGYGENDADGKAQLSGFSQGLADLGWADGRNLRMDIRWTAGNLDQARLFAKELIGLQPDVILAHTTPGTAALQRETRTIPIVFVTVSDPVGSGFVASLARSGGNITGFINLEPSMGGKWLELLLEIAPGLKRVTAIFNPGTAPYIESYYLPAFQAAARSFNVTSIIAPIHNDAEIQSVIASLGREPRNGLLLPPDSFTFVHRAPIISLAAQNQVPAVYAVRGFVRDGGLLSYGADEADLLRRAAPYVDRILKGEKPTELAVQVPTKFEMAANAKTAKALGLDVPPSFYWRADEVIE
jgi:putative tryptophan/tyrosine transport system substrate-binding protein